MCSRFPQNARALQDHVLLDSGWLVPPAPEHPRHSHGQESSHRDEGLTRGLERSGGNLQALPCFTSHCRVLLRKAWPPPCRYPQPGALSTGQALSDEVPLPCPRGIIVSSCDQCCVRASQPGPPTWVGFSQSSGPGACPSLGAPPDGSGAGRAGHDPAPSPGIPNSKLWAGGSRDWESKRKEDRGSGRGETSS